MLHGALRRIGSPRQRRYCGAAQEPEPEDHELVEDATTTTVWAGNAPALIVSVFFQSKSALEVR